MKKSSGSLDERVANSCKFCNIITRIDEPSRVFEDSISVGILDHRPIFPGHVLLLPREHFITIGDLPEYLIKPFFANVQLLSKAVEKAMEAQGTFVAMNNRVSQSIPHLHVHIVPRNKGDGLRGFFWPRQKYSSEEHKLKVQRLITEALSDLLDQNRRNLW